MSANEAALQRSENQVHYRNWLASTAPGVVLTVFVAAASIGLHRLPFFGDASPLILSILLGMAFHNAIGTPAWAKPGVAFSLRRILRAAIVLLGLQLTLGQIADVGIAGLVATAATLAATFFFTLWAGRRLGVGQRLTALIAAGTSICGASAVVAANAVVKGGDEDVAYAVATVTVFGSLSMILFPFLNGVFHLTPQAYGLWTGTSIHEIAQVVAAAFQEGQFAGHFGTIVKLTRVLMLAPVVLLLAFFWKRRAGKGHAHHKSAMPWFALGFLLMVGFNSTFPLSGEWRAHTADATTFMLAMALGAMGLETDIGKLRAKGFRPLALGASAWIFITGVGLAMAMLVM